MLGKFLHSFGCCLYNLKVLAYADDVCMVTETRSQMFRKLRICAEFAKWANLAFNAKKCAALCSIYKKVARSITPNEPFILNEEPVKVLA